MVTPLKYHSGLNLQEAEERYREVKSEFEKVKSNYSGLSGKNIENLCEEDNKTLFDCVGVLFPLSAETSVQEQLKQTEKMEDTLRYKIEVLNWQIMEYAANFKNTGVTRSHGSLGL